MRLKLTNFDQLSTIFVENNQFWNKKCASISQNFTNFRRKWPVFKKEVRLIFTNFRRKMLIFKKRSAPQVHQFDKFLQFLTKIREIAAHSLFENEPFSTKIGEIEAHSLFENWQVSTKIGENRWNWGALLIWKLAIFDENWWKLVKLRRTPFLKTGKFRRKLVKIGEIKAHSLFEN